MDSLDAIQIDTDSGRAAARLFRRILVLLSHALQTRWVPNLQQSGYGSNDNERKGSRRLVDVRNHLSRFVLRVVCTVTADRAARSRYDGICEFVNDGDDDGFLLEELHRVSLPRVLRRGKQKANRR